MLVNENEDLLNGKGGGCDAGGDNRLRAPILVACPKWGFATGVPGDYRKSWPWSIELNRIPPHTQQLSVMSLHGVQR